MTLDTAFDTALEREELQSAYRYWCRMRDGRDVPSRDSLDPLDIVSILPYINLVDAVAQVGGSYRFRHRLVGTALVERFQVEHTGMWFDDLYTPEHLERQLPAYLEAVEGRRPTVGDISLSADGEPVLAYRRLILPLADEAGAIDRLFLVFAFQSSADRFIPPADGLPLHRDGRGSRAKAG